MFYFQSARPGFSLSYILKFKSNFIAVNSKIVLVSNICEPFYFAAILSTRFHLYNFPLSIIYLKQQICKAALKGKMELSRLASLVNSKVFVTDEKIAQSKRFPQAMSRLIKISVLYVRYSYSFD